MSTPTPLAGRPGHLSLLSLSVRGLRALALLVCLSLFPARAQAASLQDLLNKEAERRTSLPKLTPEGQTAFEQLITSANSGETNRTEDLARKFLESAWTTEPRQKELAETILRVSQSRNRDLTSDERRAIEVEIRTQQQRRSEAESAISTLKTKLDAQKATEAELVTKIERAEKGLAKFGKVARSILKVLAGEEMARLIDELPTNQKNLQLARELRKQTESDAEAQQTMLQNAESRLRLLAADLENKVKTLSTEFRDSIAAQIRGMNGDGYPQIAQALANHYIRIVGSDPVVSSAGDQAIKLVKKQIRARELAGAIRAEISTLLDDKKPWKAVDQLNENTKVVEESAEGDAELLLLIAKDLGALKRRADVLIAEFLAERNGIFDRKEFLDNPLAKLTEWLAAHTDYPVQKAEADITELTRYDVEQKIAAIKAIAAARPVEAYKRANELLNSMPTRQRTVFETQLLALLDIIAKDALGRLKESNKDKVILALNAAVIDKSRHDIVFAEAQREANAIKLQVTAWTEMPLDAPTKAEFLGLVGESDKALEDFKGKTTQKGLSLSFEKLTTPMLVLAGIAGGWFFFGRRKPAV